MIVELVWTCIVGSLSAFGSACLSLLMDQVVDRVFFDRRYNVDTGGEGLLAPSSVRIVRNLIGALPIVHEDHVFIDLGSGKGRAMLVAAEFPFKRCIGVELSPVQHEVALANVERYRNGARRCQRIEPRCIDATEFEFPDAPSVIYLFNPFPRPVMERIAANLERSFRRAPRPITIIYRHPRWAQSIARLSFMRPIGLSNAVIDYYEVFSSGPELGQAPLPSAA